MKLRGSLNREASARTALKTKPAGCLEPSDQVARPSACRPALVLLTTLHFIQLSISNPIQFIFV